MDAFALKQSITNELINAIDVGVVVLDSDFCVEVWNQFMENHASIKPADIVGQSLFSHFPEIWSLCPRRKFTKFAKFGAD